MITSLRDFVPVAAETGTGLALEDVEGRLLFFLAGRRHACPAGEAFFASIGGHLEPGESWPDCARREALEETGSEVELLPAAKTWLLTAAGQITQVDLTDEPRPLGLYEMIHPSGTARSGELYRLVIYRGRLLRAPRELPPDEVGGVIAMTREQLRSSVGTRLTVAELLAGGGAVVAGEADTELSIYPIGTARVLGLLLAAGIPISPPGCGRRHTRPQAHP